jgi:hypothetical protein
MRSVLVPLGYLFVFLVYIVSTLLPYYIAYSIIEPHSFLSTVAVFLLGSIIFPLLILSIPYVLGAIGLSFSALKDRKTKLKSYKYEIKQDNNHKSIKKSKLIIYLLTSIIFICIGIIIYLINLAENHATSDLYNHSTSVAQTQNAMISDLSNNITNPENSNTSFAENYPIKNEESLVTDRSTGTTKSPNFITLGPSHLNLEIWLLDGTGTRFDMNFTNTKRPELNSYGSCTYNPSSLEGTSRFSKLIRKNLLIHSLYTCDNGETIELSEYTELDQTHVIMTLSLTENPNRVFYSGEMVMPK